MPVALCGCGTWSLSLRREHVLRVLVKMELRRIFASKGCKVTESWRKLICTPRQIKQQYLHANIRNYKLVRNKLSTGKTLPKATSSGLG